MTTVAKDIQQSHWIVVADHARAIIYGRQTRRGPLTELVSIENAPARKKIEDLISDHGGRSFDSRGKGRHTLTGDEKGPKKQIAMAFAKDIAERIHKAKSDGRCIDFGLIATPRFLGEMRAVLSTYSNTHPVFSIDKDVVGKEPKFIEKLVAESCNRP